MRNRAGALQLNQHCTKCGARIVVFERPLSKGMVGSYEACSGCGLVVTPVETQPGDIEIDGDFSIAVSVPPKLTTQQAQLLRRLDAKLSNRPIVEVLRRLREASAVELGGVDRSELDDILEELKAVGLRGVANSP